MNTRKRTVDAVVLGTSLFAAVALLGAAISAFDANRANRTPRALIGSSGRPAASSLAAAAPLDLTRAEQALTPFIPADARDHTGLAPMLMGGGDVHGDVGVPGHGHGDAAAPAGGQSHGDPTAPDSGHGDHGDDATNATVIADGDDWQGGPFEGSRIQWEPAGEHRTSAMRIVNENDVVHVYQPTDAQCAGVTPSQSDLDYGSWLVARTHDALQKYRNRPDLALSDGFMPYPIGNRYWHMINFSRLRTSNYVASADASVGSPESEVLNPNGLESFIYGMVDGQGLVPLGGMYMYDQKDLVPPDPFGCITAWHRHEGSQGFITSFDPSDPRSVWMVHVWDLSMIGPWGEHDGTHASDWWVGWRYLPNVCLNTDCL